MQHTCTPLVRSHPNKTHSIYMDMAAPHAPAAHAFHQGRPPPQARARRAAPARTRLAERTNERLPPPRASTPCRSCCGAGAPCCLRCCCRSPPPPPVPLPSPSRPFAAASAAAAANASLARALAAARFCIAGSAERCARTFASAKAQARKHAPELLQQPCVQTHRTLITTFAST